MWVIAEDNRSTKIDFSLISKLTHSSYFEGKLSINLRRIQNNINNSGSDNT
jgi:hypothetical protein